MPLGSRGFSNAQEIVSKLFSILFGRQHHAAWENTVQHVSAPILVFQSTLSSALADRR